MKLYTLSTGDIVYRYYKSIVINFGQPRKVLSTSVQNGGYREDLTAVFNNDCNPGAGMACILRAPTYEEHLRLLSDELGIDPNTVSGIATAASMKNVSIQSEDYENLTVTALVTGGVEVNGGRVGDPATYFKPNEKDKVEKPGTINIMLVLDADMLPGTLARAMVTCTEAKTAALQELMAGSNYSQGLATGSGTDGTIVIANPSSPLYLESAGKHSKLGELIGRVVKKAVKEALLKQTGLSPKLQHSVLRRVKRFGIQEETLWQEYQQQTTAPVTKQQFLESLYQLDSQQELVTYTSLYVHLLDQLSWELLSETEVVEAGNELLSALANKYNAAPSSIHGLGWKACAQAWIEVLVIILRKKYIV
jgi:adenosylcobinamide hydrolase